MEKTKQHKKAWRAIKKANRILKSIIKDDAINGNLKNINQYTNKLKRVNKRLDYGFKKDSTKRNKA